MKQYGIWKLANEAFLWALIAISFINLMGDAIYFYVQRHAILSQQLIPGIDYQRFMEIHNLNQMPSLTTLEFLCWYFAFPMAILMTIVRVTETRGYKVVWKVKKEEEQSPPNKQILKG